MKNALFLMILVLLVPICSQAQLETVTATQTFPDNSGDRLHKTANLFCDEVGNKLKELYPAKTENIEVLLDFNDGQYAVWYSCEIIRCAYNETEWYFDHRGSMSTSAYDADRRSRGQIPDVKASFKKAFVKVIIKNTDPIVASCGSRKMYIYEYFFAGPKLN
jgi:hypothetical protein